ncbi:MAG: helix-turn-helix domain-containing protein [Lachnospiraceae bacterium]|nr:helix-turn-helix domain-containing protein [Lachnospiraceae bacterium]
MENIKQIIAENISKLRQRNGITQLELAEKLNYSDKAVSKWERGESIPDITVLYEISKIFKVSLDYLVSEHDEGEELPLVDGEKNKIKKRGLITGMSIMLVWLLATFSYILIKLATDVTWGWTAFIYALPVTALVWLILNSVWFAQKRNYHIISCLMWTLLLAIWLTFFINGYNFWLLFTLGVPGQIIILMWSNISDRKKK